MRLRAKWLLTLPFLGLLAACQASDLTPCPTELDQFAAGGDTTVYDATSSGYSLPMANLEASAITRHLDGDMAFEAQYVSAPAPVNPGLGPVFNNTSCVACHKGDGGGRAPAEGGTSNTLLFRLSLDGASEDGGPVPVPGYGGQLQDSATFGVAAEAKVITRYTDVTGTFPDGTPYRLRKPTHTLQQPYQAMPEGVRLSPRLSPPVVGLGLLEALSEAAIVARVDEQDRDGDGISGRANYVWDVDAHATRLGRFGWKASTPTLRQQVAGAFQQDMGLTSALFPTEASRGQLQAVGPDEVELATKTVDDVAFYLRTLGVPARRNVADPQVVQGARLFQQANCVGCHAATFTSAAYPEVRGLGYQVFHPYTDLLLHDLGPELADQRTDFLATGQEWRTPPLWGIGLRRRVQGHEDLLHDGRANGPLEAILWHGGEAERSKQAFMRLTKPEREAMLAFVKSL